MAIAAASLASIAAVKPTLRTAATSHLRLLRTLASASLSLKKSSQNSLSMHRNRAFASHSSAPSEITTHATASTNCFPEYHRLLPCPPQNGPPRVEHMVVSEEGPVLEYITKTLHLPPLYVADLIQFGAVYYALVCPDPPPSATAEQIRIYMEATDPSFLKSRSSIKGKTKREAQKTFKITHRSVYN